MDAETTRGDDTDDIREPAAPSGWVTTGVAAKSLGVSPRTVRWHIERGNLEAKSEGEGVRRSWLVSIDSLQALRDSRQPAAQSPGGYRAEAESADIAADSPGNAIRELADRLVEEASRASEFRVRLELSERAESTLREELEAERRRREAAERRAEDLERRLQQRQEAPGAAETVEEAPERAEPRSNTAAGPQTATQRPQGGTLRGLRRRILGW
jgi:chromosome segregation ATPase